MITIMSKKYNSPMLQIVSIKKSDIVTASLPQDSSETLGTNEILAPGQRGFDDWDAGY